MAVHFHPIVRVVEYDPSIEHGIVGRKYTRPLEIDDVEWFEYTSREIVDCTAETLCRFAEEGDVTGGDLVALFISTMFTSDSVCRRSRDVLERYGVRPVVWSDYRVVDIKGISNPDAVRRYKNLIQKKYKIPQRRTQSDAGHEQSTSATLTGPSIPSGNTSLK